MAFGAWLRDAFSDRCSNCEIRVIHLECLNWGYFDTLLHYMSNFIPIATFLRCLDPVLYSMPRQSSFNFRIAKSRGSVVLCVLRRTIQARSMDLPGKPFVVISSIHPNHAVTVVIPKGVNIS